MKDYLVILSPGESWQHSWLVLGAPSANEAEQMVWTEKGYNSGEPVRVRETFRGKSANYTTTYDAKRVAEAREMVRYND